METKTDLQDNSGFNDPKHSTHVLGIMRCVKDVDEPVWEISRTEDRTKAMKKPVRIHVNSLVLGRYSNYFKQLFSHKDSKKKAEESDVIELRIPGSIDESSASDWVDTIHTLFKWCYEPEPDDYSWIKETTKLDERLAEYAKLVSLAQHWKMCMALTSLRDELIKFIPTDMSEVSKLVVLLRMCQEDDNVLEHTGCRDFLWQEFSRDTLLSSLHKLTADELGLYVESGNTIEACQAWYWINVWLDVHPTEKTNTSVMDIFMDSLNLKLIPWEYMDTILMPSALMRLEWFRQLPALFAECQSKHWAQHKRCQPERNFSRMNNNDFGIHDSYVGAQEIETCLMPPTPMQIELCGMEWQVSRHPKGHLIVTRCPQVLKCSRTRHNADFELPLGLCIESIASTDEKDVNDYTSLDRVEYPTLQSRLFGDFFEISCRDKTIGTTATLGQQATPSVPVYFYIHIWFNHAN